MYPAIPNELVEAGAMSTFPVVPRERNDCTVYAVHKATGEPYSKVLRLFHEIGRKPNKGANNWMTFGVVEQLGYDLADVTERYAHLRTIRNANNRLPDYYTYLVLVSRHILCIRNGFVEDWSRGKLLRIISLYIIYRKGDPKPDTGDIPKRSFPTVRKRRRSILD